MEQEQDEPSPNLPARRIRHDGWTAARQQAFLTALAACGCVRDACKAVGMSFASAYALRARPSAIAFRAAWDAALDCAMSRLEDAALSRAIDGVPRPVFYKGEQIGEWRDHDERLAIFLLRYRRPHRFGSQLDHLPPPPPPPPPVDPPGWDFDEPDPDEAMGRLDWHLGELTDFGDRPGQAPEPHQEAESPRANDGVNFINFDDDCDEQGAPVEPMP